MALRSVKDPAVVEKERDESCRKLGLMTPKESQRTGVARIPKFLTPDEVMQLRSRIQDVRMRAGEVRRDDQGRVGDAIGCWKTSYLHTDGIFHNEFPDIHSKIRRAIFDIDVANWGLLAKYKNAQELNFRTVEFHEYGQKGCLSAAEHYDAGSLITMDIMLASSGFDFTGGEFFTLEADGSESVPTFELGDALFFVSHKPHNVRPVIKGRRSVMVVEMWHGPERFCAHRCLDPQSCSYSLSKSQLSSMSTNVGMLG